MGVGLNADNKRIIVQGVSEIRQKTPEVLDEYGVRCVDVCAVYRSIVPPNLGQDVTPMKATRVFFWPEIMRHSKAKVTYLAIDDGSRIPEERHRFYAERRYKKAADSQVPRWNETFCEEDGQIYKTEDFPATDSDVEALSPHCMPCDRWSKMWNNPRGKKKLLGIVVECIEMILQKERLPHGMRLIIDTAESERIYYPPLLHPDKEALPEFEYGEGDLKCLLGALYFATHKHRLDGGVDYGRVLIMTIDWDVPFMTLLYDAPIDVYIGRAHMEEAAGPLLAYSPENKGQFKLTSKGAKALASSVPACEILNIPRIVEMHPTIEQRLHLLMLALCAGSVDYSLALRRFGFSEASMMAVFEKHARAGFRKHRWIWIEEHEHTEPDLDKSAAAESGDEGDDDGNDDGNHNHNPCRRVLVFDPKAFVDNVLARAKRNRVGLKTDCIAEFTREIHSILFVIRYFCCFDMCRSGRGGPPSPDFERPVFPRAFRTVTDLLGAVNPRAWSGHPLCRVEETRPPSPDTIPFHPKVIYEGQQLARILADNDDDVTDGMDLE